MKTQFSLLYHTKLTLSGRISGQNLIFIPNWIFKSKSADTASASDADIKNNLQKILWPYISGLAEGYPKH